MGPTAVAKALIAAIDGEHRPNQDNATVVVIHAESNCAPTERLVPSEETEPVRWWRLYMLGIAAFVAAVLLLGFMFTEGTTNDNPLKQDAAPQNSSNSKSGGWVTTISSDAGKQEPASHLPGDP